MNYRQAETYLNSLDFRGMRLGLDRTKALLKRLGDPHKNFKIVHVAGTNGKGSTSAMISSILTQAGIKTGLYVSPHLETFRERIQVNGRMISRAEAAELIARIKETVESPGAPKVTYFEFMTAMAFLHFKKVGVETAVVEVGLGGRFDSTNVVDPAVSIITCVAMDHRRHLGSSLKSIAREKCGIIKRGRPLICGTRDKDVARFIRERARAKGAPVWMIRKEYDNKRLSPEAKGERFNFWSVKGAFENVKAPLVGGSQVDNASMAILAALLLRGQGLAVGDSAILEGLKSVKLPARFEIVSDSPVVILDGAHNTKAASALRATLVERYGPGHINFIFGAMVDKDYKRMLKTLRPAAKSLTFFRANVPRAAGLREMMAASADKAIPTRAIEDPKNVVDFILGGREDEIFCVTGSFYMIGELRPILRRALRKKAAV